MPGNGYEFPDKLGLLIYTPLPSPAHIYLLPYLLSSLLVQRYEPRRIYLLVADVLNHSLEPDERPGLELSRRDVVHHWDLRGTCVRIKHQISVGRAGAHDRSVGLTARIGQRTHERT